MCVCVSDGEMFWVRQRSMSNGLVNSIQPTKSFISAGAPLWTHSSCVCVCVWVCVCVCVCHCAAVTSAGWIGRRRPTHEAHGCQLTQHITVCVSREQHTHTQTHTRTHTHTHGRTRVHVNMTNRALNLSTV